MERLNLSKRDIELLSGTFLFKGLCADEIRAAIERCGARKEAFSASQNILEADCACHRLGIVLKGGGDVYMPAVGARVLMSELGAGSILGAASMLCQGAKAVTTVTARKETTVLFIEEEALLELLRDDFRLTRNYLAYLTQRIHFLTGRIGSIASTNTENKLVSYIVTNADESGKVLIHGGMSALADTLSVSRASLYRAISALSDQGRIKRSGRIIQILGGKEE
ncbi:MAG: Crp/Fnr family transcriptional regulator [Clostridia bacterium]|nr:Crp/Fnr family transcriptional regulator [Clostridia bacterium]